MKNIVIVDIDGTISKVGDRIKFLQKKPKDWDSFYDACFDDKPIDSIIDLVLSLAFSYEIVFCTGRRESVRYKTEKWLNKHLFYSEFRVFPYLLVMRPNKDFRHDTQVKPEQLKKEGINFKNIAFVLEDRNSMVDKWRELGLTCLQVAEGDF